MSEVQIVDNDKTCRGCLSQNIKTFKSIFDTPGLLNKYTNCTSLEIELGDGLPTNLCSLCIDKCFSSYKFKTLCKYTEIILKRVKHNIKPPISPRIGAFGPIKDPLSTDIPKVVSTKLVVNTKQNKNNEKNPKTDNLELNLVKNIIKKPIANVIKEPKSIEIPEASILKMVAIPKKNDIEKTVKLIKLDSTQVKLTTNVLNKPIRTKESLSIFKKIEENKLLILKTVANEKKSNLNEINKPQLKIEKTVKNNMNSIVGQRVRLNFVTNHSSKPFKLFKIIDLPVLNIKKNVVTDKIDTTEINNKIDLPLVDKNMPTIAISDEFDIFSSEILSTDIYLNENNKKMNDDILIELKEEEKPLKRNVESITETFEESQLMTISNLNTKPSKNYVFNCKKCDRTFNLESLRRRHMILQHEPKRFKCTKCGKLFACSGYLRNHFNNRHLNIKRHKCDICNKLFNHKPHLKTHLLTHTGERSHLCSFCGKTFQMLEGLKIHTRRFHTGERPYSCQFCEQKFAAKKHKQKHIERVHLKELIDSNTSIENLIKPKLLFTCSICDKNLSTKHGLKRHISIHGSIRPFECYICNKTFSFEDRLKLHYQSHSIDTPYSCSICPRAFNTKSSLSSHMQTHRKDRPYSCNQCDKTYKTSDSMSKHKRVHNRKNYKACTFCDRSFPTNNKLRYHLRTHTGEKPFSCDMCDRKFLNKYSCRQHILTHTGEKPFSCTMCDKSFKMNSMLTKHKQKEHVDCPNN